MSSLHTPNGGNGDARRAVLLDKDGTLVHNVPYNVDTTQMCFTAGAMEALEILHKACFALVVVTNQPGIATGRFTAAQFDALCSALEREVTEQSGVALTGIYACPHTPDRAGRPTCACRKPGAGLLRQAATELGLDLHRSWMIGDILDDVEAGRRAGCRTILLDVGNETEWHWSPLRVPHYRCADLGQAARHIVSAHERTDSCNAEAG